jgi:hypothetical protein
MKTALEADLAGPHLSNAGNVLNPLGNLIPRRVVFVGWRISRCFDGMMFEDERVQGDDFGVAVEDINGELAGNVGRDGGDMCVDFFLAQHFDQIVLGRKSQNLLGEDMFKREEAAAEVDVAVGSRSGSMVLGYGLTEVW